MSLAECSPKNRQVLHLPLPLSEGRGEGVAAS